MTTKLETYAISHENSSNELIRETPYSAQETVNSQQLAILKKNFPSCFDKNGAFLPNKLAELVGTETEVSQEFYELNWLGRSYAKYLRNAPPEMLMTEDTEHNAEPINQDSQNLLIQGDNLEVLKHLKSAYAEQVKMIYIDPPYNTGSDGFVYQDDRKFTPQQLSELANVPIEEAERILAFTAKGSNSHSAWLTFMYPRLYVARELLKDDGVIFISIDDNEVNQLKSLCDEIFGEINFIAQIVVNSNSSKNNSKNISITHEYILCYVKAIEFQTEEWKVEKQQIKSFETKAKQLLKMNLSENEIHEELLQLVKYPRFYDFDHFTFADKNGVYETDNPGGVENGNFDTEIIHPITGKVCAMPVGGWRYKDESLKDMVKNNQLFFGKDETTIPRVKRYLHDYKEQVPKSNIYFDSQSTTKWLKSENIPFSFPKSIELIKYILTMQNDKNSIILDFFAGSGTTAHAVMLLNSEDNGNRKFISVQIPEDLHESLKKASSQSKPTIQEAINVLKKLGKPQTVFEITKLRIVRASQKIREENPQATGDFGFKIYKTTPQLINHNLAFDLDQLELPELLEIQPDDYLALLTTWRLYDGAKLTEKVTDIDLDGYTAHLCQQNLYLMYPDFQPKHLIQLIKLLDNDPSFTPNRVIMLGETIDSSRQNEIYQALKDYANKKSLDLSVIVRNI
ncbi:site-specific DNA-methyltransferase [Moraxella sp. K02]